MYQPVKQPVTNRQSNYHLLLKPKLILDLEGKREPFTLTEMLFQALNYLAPQSKLDAECELNHWTGSLPDKWAHLGIPLNTTQIHSQFAYVEN